MGTNAVYTLGFRRKREGKTNYKKRLELLKSNKTRLVVRRTNSAVIVQFTEYNPEGDKVVVTFHSSKLNTFGWNFSKKSIPACYLAGLAAGVIAKKHKIKEAILDIGLQTPKKGSKMYAVLKGVVDAGVMVPSSKEIFPSEERLMGKHIESNTADNFSGYKKQQLDVKSISKSLEEVKKKILS